MKKSIYWIAEDRIIDESDNVGEWFRYSYHYQDREAAVAFVKDDSKNLESRLIRVEVIEIEIFETP